MKQSTNIVAYTFQDWRANPRNPKARFVLTLFRLAQRLRQLPSPLWIVFAPVTAFYMLTVEGFLGIELPIHTRVGPRLKLFHATALVVNRDAVLGADCTLRNSTTIGNKATGDSRDGCPVIADNVDIGANSVVIGPIRVGKNAVIGAGSVVVKEVPDDAIVVGNPARVLRINRPPELPADTDCQCEKQGKNSVFSATPDVENATP